MYLVFEFTWNSFTVSDFRWSQDRYFDIDFN